MAYSGNPKGKPYVKTVLTGIMSVTLYIVLLLNQHIIMEYFGRGGFYAIFPIATAFLFSVVHGTFTGNFWTVMGVEASKKHREVK